MEWNSISYVIQYTTGKLNFCHPFKCIDRGIYKILLYNLCTSKRYTDQIYIVICEGKRKKNKQTKHTSSRQSKAKKKPFQKWTTLNRWWILSQCLHRENKGASKKWKYRVTASVGGLWLVHKLKSCTLARTIYYSRYFVVFSVTLPIAACRSYVCEPLFIQNMQIFEYTTTSFLITIEREKKK